ncbi:TPA: hypothetical protein DDW35_13760, partial [Candidatus Sumerlaeota bacterium]|nr:hypothetical protein [Candidatus Sumerlaeota bacterium]
MKRNGIDHPKTLMLSELLEIPTPYAVGILECLWHWTAKFAKRGDIGRYSNAVIANGVKWPESSERLIGALVDAALLDKSDVCRLCIHDWSEHCEDSIHMALARSVELFADGSIPKLTKFSGKSLGKGQLSERDTILKSYHDKFPALFVRTDSAREPHDVRKETSPEPHEERTDFEQKNNKDSTEILCAQKPHCHSLSLGLSRSLKPLSPPTPNERENSEKQNTETETATSRVAELWNEKRLDAEQGAEPTRSVALQVKQCLLTGVPEAELIRAVENYAVQFPMNRAAGQNFFHGSKKFFGGEHFRTYSAPDWKPTSLGKMPSDNAARAAPVAKVVPVNESPVELPVLLSYSEAHWQNALKILETQIDEANFKTWILTAKYCGHDAEGTVWLQAPSTFNANWLRRHHAEYICKALGCEHVEFAVVK